MKRLAIVEDQTAVAALMRNVVANPTAPVNHAPDFLTAGGVQAELDALNAVIHNARVSTAHPALGEVEALVIQYAAQMTLDVKVSDAVFNGLRLHFDNTEIVELTSAIATYNMVARFLVALGVTPEA